MFPVVIVNFPCHSVCAQLCNESDFFLPASWRSGFSSLLSVSLNRAVWYRKGFQQCLAGQSPVKIQLLFHFREFVQCLIAAGHNFAFYVGKTTKPLYPCFSRCLCSDYLCTPAILIKTSWPWPANAPTSTWWKNSSSEITLMFTEAV